MVRVINVGKSVGPTTMHWNDLYGTLREVRPGVAYPTLSIFPFRGPLSIQKTGRNGAEGKYFGGGILAGMIFLRNLERRKRNPLVVHLHTPMLGVFFMLAHLIGVRFNIVVTQHNEWSGFRWYQKAGLLMSSLVSKYYVVCGQQILRSIPTTVRRLLSRATQVCAIPNGIPESTMRLYANKRCQEIRERGACQGEPVTIVLAKMSPQKNCWYLLRLIAEVPELGKVRWFGTGPMAAELATECERLRLGGRVRFEGVVPREEVYEALAGADFYLTASLWEGLSVADLEAAGIGCEPLMSDIAQRQEIAEAGGFSLLSVDDFGPWREATRRYALLDAESRAKSGINLSKRVCAAFSLGTMVERYWRVYRSATRT